MKAKASLLAGVAALGLSGLASAASFDFTGADRLADGNYSAANFLEGGVSLTVTPTGNTTKVVGYWEGLGGFSTGADIGTFDDCCSVSPQDKDQLVFTFGSKVTLGGISFRQWENGFDKVDLVTDTGTTYQLRTSTSSASAGLIDYFAFATPLTLQSFTLKAVGGAGTATYVHGLQNANLVSQVPVPAAAWLMGSALVGLAGVARRKQVAA